MMMMMTTTSNSLSSLPASLAGRNWGDEVQVRFKNIQTIGGNFVKSSLQDTHTFKIGSALIASFALVLARVYIATGSARKEADTTGTDSDSTAFCKDQALMTTVREMGGFLTSWLFMSLFNVAMDKPSQLLFGVRLNKHGVTGPIAFISKLGQQFIPFTNRVLEESLPTAVGCKRTLHILGEPSTFTSVNPTPLETYFSELKPNKVQLFFRKGLELLISPQQLKKELSVEAFHQALPNKLTREEKTARVLNALPKELALFEDKVNPSRYKTALIERGFNNFSTYVVPVVGAGISTVVAGWMLERATLLHFPEIIDKINQLRIKKKPTTAETTVAPLFEPVKQPVCSPCDNTYLKQVLSEDLPVFSSAFNQLQPFRPMNSPSLW